MPYRDNQRYQFQPWHVKLGRHLKYRPVWLALVAWHYLAWLLRGAPKEDWHRSRWQTAKQAFDIWRGLYDIDIGHTYTGDEWREAWERYEYEYEDAEDWEDE